MIRFNFVAIFLLSFQLTVAQNTSTEIEMVELSWEVPKDAKFEKFDNRKTLVLNSGRATVKNQSFTNGTLEVDVYANSVRSFAGITFRKQNDNMEEVYMRLHKSSQVDAVQYTPIFNNESNWQLFREYQAKVSFKNTGWNTLRIEVNDESAVVFVNDEQVLSIDNLRTGKSAGEIGLFALFTNRFANFSITHKNKLDKTQEIKDIPTDEHIIAEWKITEAKPYKSGELNFKDFSKEKYMSVKTEKSGLLPISKYIKKTTSGNFEENEEDYTVATTTIVGKKSEIRQFSFDYSDKIIVYLNGEPIFKGNNAFRTKGVQYMGHLDIDTNKLFLPLKKGVNQLHCVVIDKANGWGLMGKLD